MSIHAYMTFHYYPPVYYTVATCSTVSPHSPVYSINGDNLAWGDSVISRRISSRFSKRIIPSDNPINTLLTPGPTLTSVKGTVHSICTRLINCEYIRLDVYVNVALFCPEANLHKLCLASGSIKALGQPCINILVRGPVPSG